MKIQDLLEDMLGTDIPVGIRAYDGTHMGPENPPASLVIHSIDALRRVVTRPGELGFARSYIAGDVDIEGDIYEFINLNARLPQVKLKPRQILMALRILGLANLRLLPIPKEELTRKKGLLHSKERDLVAVSHHYDVSNDFYRCILGPSMTYSCAVFNSESDNLEQAQINKYDLICRKLNLQPGDRFLDIGCGWGGMAEYAAKEYGAKVVAITIADRQVEYARKRIMKTGLEKQVDVRKQDYRDLTDAPFDAICSIGMFEHAGLSKRSQYFAKVFSLTRDGGRLLNHAISRRALIQERTPQSGFVDRYVFPDGEAIEIGKVISAIQQAGFEAKHMENLREHYVLTLRHWVNNLETNWEQAVAASSLGRTRVWKLYLAGASIRFAWNHLNVNQVLAVKSKHGLDTESGPLRPNWGR